MAKGLVLTFDQARSNKKTPEPRWTSLAESVREEAVSL